MVFYFKSKENRIKRCRLDKAVLQPFLTGIAANGGKQNASFIYVEIHDIFWTKLNVVYSVLWT